MSGTLNPTSFVIEPFFFAIDIIPDGGLSLYLFSTGNIFTLYAGDPEDSEAIENYLRHIKDWESVTGTVNVDPETGEAYLPCPIIQVTNGEFKLVKYIDVSDLLYK